MHIAHRKAEGNRGLTLLSAAERRAIFSEREVDLIELVLASSCMITPKIDQPVPHM